MSVKDLNKVIILSSALTGKILTTIDYEDYIKFYAAEYMHYKIRQLLENEEGVILKVGNKP